MVYNNFGMKSPEQLQGEYNQMMNNYRSAYDRMNQLYPANSMYNINSTQNIPIPNTQNGGDYRYVNSYEEVLNASTRLDGTATLFVNFANGIIWSKKFVNGSHEIQTFKFYPLANSNEDLKETEQKEETNQVTKNDLKDIYVRLEKLENGGKDEYKTNTRNSEINN